MTQHFRLRNGFCVVTELVSHYSHHAELLHLERVSLT